MTLQPIVRKIKKNKKNILKILAVIVAVAGMLVILYVADAPEPGSSTAAQEEDEDRQITYFNGKAYRFKDNVQTVLLIGIDKYLEEINIPEDTNLNTQQADFVVLLIIDNSTRSYKMLQINRDTMVPVRELGLNGEVLQTVTEQLALSHTYGNGGKESCRNTVKSVESLLFGIDIEHYVAFTMDAIPIINDEAGGVTVLIEDDFSAVDPELVKGQEITLKGDQSLEYIRARGQMSDPTNIARMGRHRTYMNALLTAALAKMEANSTWGAKTVGEVWEYLTTDLLTGGISDMADILAKYERGEILTIEGETKTTDFVEFYPNEDALKKQVIELFFEPVSE